MSGVAVKLCRRRILFTVCFVRARGPDLASALYCMSCHLLFRPVQVLTEGFCLLFEHPAGGVLLFRYRADYRLSGVQQSFSAAC